RPCQRGRREDAPERQHLRERPYGQERRRRDPRAGQGQHVVTSGLRGHAVPQPLVRGNLARGASASVRGITDPRREVDPVAMRRIIAALGLLLLVCLVAGPAEGGNASATGCGAKEFSYAGLQSDTTAHGVSASLSTTAAPGVINGHVGGWIGVGGV